MTTNPVDVPLPCRANLEAILAHIHPAGGALNPPDLSELIEAANWALKSLPDGLDFVDVISRNPLTQVYFRAGLLACREYMARFVEQGGHPEIAQSIRANWWPNLGSDPGVPRLFEFDEICEESDGPDGKPLFEAKEISASVEALPRAYQFLQTVAK